MMFKDNVLKHKLRLVKSLKKSCTRGDGCFKGGLSTISVEILMCGNLPCQFSSIENVLPLAREVWMNTNMDLDNC